MERQFLSEIFSNVLSMNNLATIAINNNDFHENKVEHLLRQLFELPQLTMLSISDNKKISGKFPEYSHFTEQQKMQILLLHNLELTGKLPNNLSFTNMKYMTLYKNRLACSLPPQFISENASLQTNFTAMVLSSNLFSVSHERNMPIWMKNSKISLKSAKSTYITYKDTIRSYILTGFSSLLLLLMIIIIFKTKYHRNYSTKCSPKQYTKENSHLLLQRKYSIGSVQTNIFQRRKNALDQTEFSVVFDRINVIKEKFNNIYIVFIVISLLIIYGLKSEYYDPGCINWSDIFSVAFFYNDNQFVNWCMVFIWIILIIIYLQIIISLDVDIKLTTNHIITTNKYVDQYRAHQLSKTKIILTALFYITLYILCIFIMCLYIISESLPTENTLNLSEYEIVIIRQSISWVLALSNSIVIPEMVDSIYKVIHCKSFSMIMINKNRSIIIFILRTLSTIFIPITFSIILLNDCGHGWTLMWSQCYGDNINNFDVSASMHIFNYTTNPDMSLSNYAESCGIQPIIWNSCIRQFMYSWTTVIIEKLLIMVFMPFIVMIFTLLKYKILPKLLCACCRFEYIQNNLDNPRINVDIEYAMIATKIESMIIFSFITPFVIPITIISIYSNSAIYHYLVTKQKWNIYPFQTSLILIPIKMTLIGVLTAQIFIILFTIYCINDNILSIVLIALLIIINIYFIQKRTNKKSVDYDNDIHSKKSKLSGSEDVTMSIITNKK